MGRQRLHARRIRDRHSDGELILHIHTFIRHLQSGVRLMFKSTSTSGLQWVFQTWSDIMFAMKVRARNDVVVIRIVTTASFMIKKSAPNRKTLNRHSNSWQELESVYCRVKVRLGFVIIWISPFDRMGITLKIRWKLCGCTRFVNSCVKFIWFYQIFSLFIISLFRVFYNLINGFQWDI